MTNELVLEYEKAVRFLAKTMPVCDETSRKPYLSHDIRVGTYLHEHGYGQDVVVAGLLHDVIEWSKGTEQIIREEFGDRVAKLVLANTKDDSIEDKVEKMKDLIVRGIACGEEALIIKAADTIDSFKWYMSKNNISELKGHCLKITDAIFELKPEDFKDKIFEELWEWKGEAMKHITSNQ